MSTTHQSLVHEQLPVEQLLQLLKQSPAAFLATMALMIYVVTKLYNVADDFWLSIWAGSIFMLNAYLLVWLYFVKKAKLTRTRAIRYTRFYQLQAILHGFCWGLLPFLLINNHDPELHFFAYIILCGMSTGAIATTAMIYHIYLSFMLPTVLPVILTQLLAGSELLPFSTNVYQVMILYAIALLVLAHTYYDSVKNSIKLVVENSQLLETTTSALKKAEAASHAKSQFLANMSHELRTPLNTVIGYSEMIHENAQDNYFDTIENDTRKITLSGKHLLTLINNILDLSKIESGKMDVYVEKIDLQSLFNELRPTTEALFKKNNNSLSCITPQDPGFIESDLTKIKQILLNILSNCAKFTTNGEVSILVTNLPGLVEIRISDTGIGMDKQQLATLTEPFVQADITTNRKYGGTGLGMSLTQSLANILGIRLNVRSQPGEGSIFTLTIPRAFTPITQPQPELHQ